MRSTHVSCEVQCLRAIAIGTDSPLHGCRQLSPANRFFEDRFGDHPYFFPCKWPDRPLRDGYTGRETARHSTTPNKTDGAE